MNQLKSALKGGGRFHHVCWTGFVLIVALGWAACDSSGVAEDQPARVTLSVTGTSPSKSRTFTDAEGNTLTIDRAEIILREIEFERAEDLDSCQDEDDDACEKIEQGPVLVNVPLGSSTPERVLEAELPAGRWEEVEFDVHKLDRDDPDDRRFLDETRFPEGVSIRVTGTWSPADASSQSFTYVSDLNEEQEIELNPPLNVTAGTTANVTFRVDLDTWFRDDDGRLVNPEEGNKGEALEDLIEENIEESIEAFEDDDRDGDDDDGDDS